MDRTFEEMAGRELDSLYQGALFLSGGDARVAERLLVETMTSSFRVHDRTMPAADLANWLEGRLAKQLLRDAARVPGVLKSPAGANLREAFDGVAADTLFTSAAALPEWPRVAVWLVLLRRWTYEAACDVLEVDRDVLHDLLSYRDVLMTEVLRGSGRKTGTDGVGT